MYEFKFSDIGEGLHEGKILELKLRPGDAVEQGDILAVVETDKVVAEITSSVTGVLNSYGSHAGDIIKVGDTLAYISVEAAQEVLAQPIHDKNTGLVTEERSAKTEGDSVVGRIEVSDDLLPPSDEIGVSDVPIAAESNATQAGIDPASNLDGQALVTPATRRLARDLNVDLSELSASGNSVRIHKEDVVAAAEAKSPVPKAESIAADQDPFGFPLTDDPLNNPTDLPPGKQIELTILRKTIARNMEISGRIPSAIIHDLGAVDDLVELRSKVNKDRAVHISYQPFFMKALSIALLEVPVLNATYDSVTQEVTAYREVNIGFAVNTEAGVLLPVIRGVETSTILQIDAQMKRLVQAARSRALVSDNLRGGTIALTNFGPFGGLWARPMIFPPQVAILGLGRIHEAPQVVAGGAIEARTVLPVSLAFDHRVVDGVPAATFVSRFLELLCSPQELMVSL